MGVSSTRVGDHRGSARTVQPAPLLVKKRGILYQRVPLFFLSVFRFPEVGRLYSKDFNFSPLSCFSCILLDF